jgi:hypothetical protein
MHYFPPHAHLPLAMTTIIPPSVSSALLPSQSTRIMPGVRREDDPPDNFGFVAEGPDDFCILKNLSAYSFHK